MSLIDREKLLEAFRQYTDISGHTARELVHAAPAAEPVPPSGDALSLGYDMGHREAMSFAAEPVPLTLDADWMRRYGVLAEATRTFLGYVDFGRLRKGGREAHRLLLAALRATSSEGQD